MNIVEQPGARWLSCRLERSPAEPTVACAADFMSRMCLKNGWVSLLAFEVTSNQSDHAARQEAFLRKLIFRKMVDLRRPN